VGSSGKYEWDEAKRRSNLGRHGVDFADAGLLDWDAAFRIAQTIDGERRVLAFAPINSRLFAIVYTLRGETVRIISFRKANDREMDRYEKQVY